MDRSLGCICLFIFTLAASTWHETHPWNRRKLYDETGIAQDMEHRTSDSSFDDLYNYYRSMYAKVCILMYD